MHVLITGGAGYIGSHTVALMCDSGHQIVAVDNLSRGHSQAVHPKASLVIGDIHNNLWLADLMKEYAVQGVIHFAAESQVALSQKDPLHYYQANVAGTLSLIQAMLDSKVNQIVFSSSAAVYGAVETIPISEDTPRAPTNVYGRTKAMIEDILVDCANAYGISFASLRYFNAAGASLKYNIGEDHVPETHLIPSVAAKMMRGERPVIFGRDYPTPDGTCIRDYIHVDDLASAHVKALEWLHGGGDRLFVNLGSGSGYSNLQVLEAVARCMDMPIDIDWQGRRPGDPDTLVAEVRRAETVLGWKPMHSALEAIVDSALRWHSSNPQGFGGNTEWDFERR